LPIFLLSIPLHLQLKAFPLLHPRDLYLWTNGDQEVQAMASLIHLILSLLMETETLALLTLVIQELKKCSADGKFITKWGSKGSGDGEFLHPEGIDIDSARNVYVADTGNSRVEKNVLLMGNSLQSGDRRARGMESSQSMCMEYQFTHQIMFT
jgi:hypothetical protein